MLPEEEEAQPKKAATGKRKASTAQREEQGGAKHTKGAHLDQWGLLPTLDSKWMRALLEIPGESFLTLLPCIKDERIMPSEVCHILGSGRGKIAFYANVVHVTLCPRYLVNGNVIHRHHNENVVALCITEKVGEEKEVNRLFVRCFSEKCLHLRRQLNKIPSNWEEYKESHHTRYTRLVIEEKKKARAKKTSQEETVPDAAGAT
jgi:hypothetical protein